MANETSIRKKAPSEIDLLADDLRKRLEQSLNNSTHAEVRFSDGDRALYATDGSNYRYIPIGIVIPRTVDDVVAAMKVCYDHDVPVLSRGGGTDLTGSTTNTAVIFDMSKYLNQIIEIDPQKKTARIQPGIILDDLRKAAVEKCSLTFGPDPATHTHNTLGGMIGNNSCGVHSVMATKAGIGPRTSDNIQELEILTYDGHRFRVGPTSELELERIIRRGDRRGQIYKRLKDLRDHYANHIRSGFPNIPRRVSGYNLDELLPEKGFNVARALVGTEGTLVTVLEATVQLIPHPQFRSLALLGYPSVFEAADHVPQILEFGPIGLEGIDHKLIEHEQIKKLHEENLKYLPEGKGFLLVEFGGETEEDVKSQIEKMRSHLMKLPSVPHIKTYSDPETQKKVWEIRESGLGATARVPHSNDTWPGWEDSAVAPAKVGDYLREVAKLYKKYNYDAALYGHFGQGCIHSRIPFILNTQEGVKNYRSFIEEAANLCIQFGGSLSGEHGDGQSRGEVLGKMYGPELMQAFREFKSIWDPRWKMNPGKVIDARPITADLRMGPEYNPLPVTTHFKYPEDSGSFARATTRCVGVGKCRRIENGTMCPSFMVTREEKHSTRGRARLLFEMLQGNPIKNQWQSEAVKESLDLCLACKGCKGECPVNVDMATYKAEFLSHYYDSHPRPIAAYSMGYIHIWSRLASTMPGIVNFIFKTPGLSEIAKQLGGISQKRTLPLYAPETFQTWFKKRLPTEQAGPRVLLWPDTFNNHFHPETAKSATRVLEAAGFNVQVPQAFLCCGRPLYDFGFLEEAKRQILQIVDSLRHEIRAGVPLVGLEPSCVSVFRDEMINLFPNDLDVKRLHHQTFTLAEFLQKHAPNFEPPKLHKKVIIQMHCHHKSVLGDEADRKLLKKMEVEAEFLDSGCCGMAGSFGFEPEKHEVSQACGERVLLPEVRKAPSDAIIMTEGFSCRTQIEQETPRKALHLAQVIDMALQADRKPEILFSEYPENLFMQPIAETSNHSLPLAKKFLMSASLLISSGYLLKKVLSKNNEKLNNSQKHQPHP
jgi:FAD/FMN-containing dehydrogenase/Fe-S oxidoreductase